MPKTNEKDAYFFSHDCNARNDPKILALRSVYGAEGYGVYFMLVEILREQPEYRLSVNKYIWNTLATRSFPPAGRSFSASRNRPIRRTSSSISWKCWTASARSTSTTPSPATWTRL